MWLTIPLFIVKCILVTTCIENIFTHISQLWLAFWKSATYEHYKGTCTCWKKASRLLIIIHGSAGYNPWPLSGNPNNFIFKQWIWAEYISWIWLIVCISNVTLPSILTLNALWECYFDFYICLYLDFSFYINIHSSWL